MNHGFAIVNGPLELGPHHVEIPPSLWPDIVSIRNKRHRCRMAKAYKRFGYKRWGPNPKNPPEPLTFEKVMRMKAIFTA
jgi:hypothetical protein